MVGGRSRVLQLQVTCVDAVSSPSAPGVRKSAGAGGERTPSPQRALEAGVRGGAPTSPQAAPEATEGRARIDTEVADELRRLNQKIRKLEYQAQIPICIWAFIGANT